jgi:DNA-binding XRE family transcriptional regulator
MGEDRLVQSKRERLIRARKAAGLTQERFAEALGVERTTVVRWEAGDHEPRPPLWPKIARVLGLNLKTVPDLWQPPTAYPATSPNWPMESSAHPAGTDLVTVAQLRESVHQLDGLYDHVPSTALLAETGQRLGQIAFLSSHIPSGRIRRQLLAVEAAAAILMGQLVWDASQRRDHHSAGGYFTQAIRAARQLGDPVAEDHARLRYSFLALYGEKDAHKGLWRAAQVGATTSSSVLAGLGLLHAAEAHAMLQQAEQCEAALEAARRKFERISPVDPAGELFSYTQIDRMAGSCYLFLGDHDRAAAALTRTAAALHDRRKSRAIVLGNLTLAHLRQRHLDAATATLHSAMDVVEQTRAGGGLNVVFEAGRELSRWRHEPVVQDVYDRLMSLMTSG